MKAVLNALEEVLKEVEGVRYVSENTGQLDNYSPNFPTQFPCILYDIAESTFSNIGIDRNVQPMNRQMAEYVVELRFANMKTTNPSAAAPTRHKDVYRHIWDIMEDTHKLIHGKSPEKGFGPLMRSLLARVTRDDGVQEYVVRYTGTGQGV
jgi:hypothetical protein